MASLKFHHERLGFTVSSFQHIQMRLALRSLKFTMRTHVSPAPPFPPSLLGPLAAAAGILEGWAFAFRTLVVFAFFTFARLSSLVPAVAAKFDCSRWPTVADLRVKRSVAFLRFSYSKTRQAADGGFEVPMRAARQLPCPLQLAKLVLDRARRLGLRASAPLFSGTGATGEVGVSLPQAQARWFLKRCLVSMGLPGGAFSFHSFRRGGCSLAFQQGAVEADLALQGDWRSEAIKAYYPADVARLRVADALARELPTSLP